MAKKTLEERFWEKVNVRGPDECWEWQASCRAKGYGQFYLRGKPEKAHRVAWELTHGPIPNNLCVLHQCDNPSCVNPDHLFLGTVLDNNRDMLEKDRHAKGAKIAKPGEKNGNSKLTRRQVLEIRRRWREGERERGAQRRMAAEYGVTPTLIYMIIREKAWRHLL